LVELPGQRCARRKGQVMTLRSCFKNRRPAAGALIRQILVSLLGVPLVSAWGQPDPATSLASRSAIVVQGTVEKMGASEEPLLAPTPSTAVIRITRMFAGSEFAGDLKGQIATVILTKPGSVQAGTAAIFFGNPRFIGKTLTIADEGELPAPAGEAAISVALARGIQGRRDAPIRARLTLAAMVFRGTVESVKPIASADGKERELTSEHDPEWQLAMVKVTEALRGTQNGAVVAVLFPSSSDIMWFNSPKLKPGQDALFLAHNPQPDELRVARNSEVFRLVEATHALVVSQPYDVLLPAEEQRLAGLLQTKEVQ
jgi:hypothetical protein